MTKWRLHYWLFIRLWIDQKSLYQLDADPKAIQQIEFAGQLKRLDNDDNATDSGADQSFLVETILEKIKETGLRFSQESVTVL